MPGLLRVKKSPSKSVSIRLSPAKNSPSTHSRTAGKLFATPKKSTAKKPVRKTTTAKKMTPLKRKTQVKRAATTGKKVVRKSPAKKPLGKLVYKKLPAGSKNCPEGYHMSRTYKDMCIKNRGVGATRAPPKKKAVAPKKKVVAKKAVVKRPTAKIVYTKLRAGRTNCPVGTHRSSKTGLCIGKPRARKCLPGQHFDRRAKRCVGTVDHKSLPMFIKKNIKKVAKEMKYTKTNSVEWTSVFKRTVKLWKQSQ